MHYTVSDAVADIPYGSRERRVHPRRPMTGFIEFYSADGNHLRINQRGSMSVVAFSEVAQEELGKIPDRAYESEDPVLLLQQWLGLDCPPGTLRFVFDGEHELSGAEAKEIARLVFWCFVAQPWVTPTRHRVLGRIREIMLGREALRRVGRTFGALDAASFVNKRNALPMSDPGDLALRPWVDGTKTNSDHAIIKIKTPTYFAVVTRQTGDSFSAVLMQAVDSLAEILTPERTSVLYLHNCGPDVARYDQYLAFVVKGNQARSYLSPFPLAMEHINLFARDVLNHYRRTVDRRFDYPLISM